MKTIDLSRWNRRKHFELFKTYRQPFFNVCFDLDLTRFLPAVKSAGQPFFLAFVHAVMNAANRTEALRLRIRGEAVVLHDVVSPSFTMMTDEGVFRFVTVPYDDDLALFLKRAADTVEVAKKDVSVSDEPGKDDLVFLTSMPWITFTSVEHAMPGHPDDSFPRLTWGKYHDVSGRILIPFSVAAHHALVDGADVGAFATELQAILNDR